MQHEGGPGRGPKDWIQLVDGAPFWPMAAQPSDITIEAIAHGLSHVCRFGGHVKKFYSVAQHSVLVSHVCDPADALHGLLHDATEGLGLLDMPRPVKHAPELAGYRAAERRLEGVIAKAFGLADTMPLSVKRADEVLLATERRDLMSTPLLPWAEHEQRFEPLPTVIEAWSPERARTAFLYRFDELTGRRRDAWEVP